MSSLPASESLAEFARRLGVPLRTVLDLRARGRLATAYLGRRVLVEASLHRLGHATRAQAPTTADHPPEGGGVARNQS